MLLIRAGSCGCRYGRGPEEEANAVEDDRLAEIATDLGAICERLDDLALDLLRQAVAAGEQSRPEPERRVVRARNAIERARRLLEPR